LKRNYLWLSLSILLATAVCYPIIDPDIFMYLSFGRLMMGQGAIPASDPYVYTDSTWLIYHEWLSCLVFYFFFFIGGYPGLLVMRVGLWLTALWAMIRSGRKWQLPEIPMAIVIVVTLLSCVHRFIDRASFFSDLMLCFLTAYFLATKRPSRRVLFFLPALFVFWVNLHPAFVLGLAVYSLYLISRPLSDWPRVGLSFVSCSLACLLNPRFFEGAIFPLQRAFEPDFKKFREMTFEWMSPFKQPFLSTMEVKFFLVLIVATLALFVWRFAKKREVPIFALLAFIFYLYVAQEAVRFLTTTALSITMITFFLMRDLKFPIATKWERMIKPVLSVIAIVASIYIFEKGYPATSGPRHFGAGVNAADFPIGAVAFIQEHGLKGRIFNQYEWGSYLVWTLNEKDSIFIHTFHSDPKLLSDVYYGMGKSKEQFEAMVSKYDIRYALLEKHYYPTKPIIFQNLEGWKIIFEDHISVLWQRPGSER
jgi:hypothetical protein